MKFSLKTSLLFLLPSYVFGASRFVGCYCQYYFSGAGRRNKAEMQQYVMLGCRPRQVVKHIKGNFLFKSCLPNSALKLSIDEETESELCCLEMILVFCNTKQLHSSVAHLQYCPPLQYIRTPPPLFKTGRNGALEKAGTGWLLIYTLGLRSSRLRFLRFVPYVMRRRVVWDQISFILEWKWGLPPPRLQVGE